VALNRRVDRPPSCPVLGVFLPRQPLTGAAVDETRSDISSKSFAVVHNGLFWVARGRGAKV